MHQPAGVRAEIVCLRARGLAAELARLSLPAGDAKRLGRMVEALVASADELMAEATADRRPAASQIQRPPMQAGNVIDLAARRRA